MTRLKVVSLVFIRLCQKSELLLPKIDDLFSTSSAGRRADSRHANLVSVDDLHTPT